MVNDAISIRGLTEALRTILAEEESLPRRLSKGALAFRTGLSTRTLFHPGPHPSLRALTILQAWEHEYADQLRAYRRIHALSDWWRQQARPDSEPAPEPTSHPAPTGSRRTRPVRLHGEEVAAEAGGSTQLGAQFGTQRYSRRGQDFRARLPTLPELAAQHLQLRREQAASHPRHQAVPAQAHSAAARRHSSALLPDAYTLAGGRPQKLLGRDYLPALAGVAASTVSPPDRPRAIWNHTPHGSQFLAAHQARMALESPRYDAYGRHQARRRARLYARRSARGLLDAPPQIARLPGERRPVTAEEREQAGHWWDSRWWRDWPRQRARLPEEEWKLV